MEQVLVKTRKKERIPLPRITVIGIGGAGCSIISWLKEKEVEGTHIIALSNDVYYLRTIQADKKIPIGYPFSYKEFTKEVAAKAVFDRRKEIEDTIAGSRLVFIVAGLGGVTGTSISPLVATIVKEMNLPVIGVFITPFHFERERRLKAVQGLRALKICDTLVLIDNDVFFAKIAGTLPLHESITMANELIADYIKNLSEMIMNPSLLNLNLADLQVLKEKGKFCTLGVGSGYGEYKIFIATENSFNNLLYEIHNLNEITGALVMIEGGDNMTLEDVNLSGEIVISKLKKDAKIAWSARVNSDLENSCSVILTLCGLDLEEYIRPPQFIQKLIEVHPKVALRILESRARIEELLRT